ncbi:hypothetical protein PACTADRAFT_48890 [Pachysolen tannophilus NRRL Y-2460]|uniref:Uncharacterized protein n=1 Tax=Pachysolen tannophilus NRRL Y-2460 TaxID=669874 RepID=A0A1E4TZH1_PACTA|nr:hypothetical protein PACTADRAFT_48890 [Pachysolen tannophilus NRRL Y-2460]
MTSLDKTFLVPHSTICLRFFLLFACVSPILCLYYALHMPKGHTLCIVAISHLL